MALAPTAGMGSRETRARLLAPSFLVVAAAACGPTHIARSDDRGGGGPKEEAGTGGNALLPEPGGTGGITVGTGGSYGRVG